MVIAPLPHDPSRTVKGKRTGEAAIEEGPVRPVGILR